MGLKQIISNPLNVFLGVWGLILLTFQLKVALFFPTYSYTHYIYPIISILFYSLGFFILKFNFKMKKGNKTETLYIFINKKFNRFVYMLIFISIFIVILNINFFGMPPMLSFFGFDTHVYLKYGRLKGILFAFLIFLFIISIYARGVMSFIMKFFSISILLLYVSRGNIIFSIIIYFYLLIYENKINNKKLFYLLIGLIIFILGLFQILGELRTGTEVFYNSLEIRDKYRIENSGLIWFISYVSMPFVNFLELINYNDLYYGENIISRSLPAFLSFNQDAIMFYKSIIPNKCNTVATYLATVYLDFGIIGIIIYNFFLGLISSYIYYFSQNKIIKSILMTCITLLFFVDYFFYFTTIILIILSVLFNHYVFKRRKITYE